jgi:ribonucleoside-diphosphate reductase alpha chain
MAGELGPFPGYKKNAEEHAARDPQPPPRRLRRVTGYEDLSVNPVPLDHANCPDQRPDRPCHRAWDKALSWAKARLPQRAGHRDCADRHHRPGHGLRHHRHRARLRAGEVQEAGRRRLLQDHQPRRPRGAAHAGLHRSQIAEIEAYAVGHGTLAQAPGINPARSRPRASPTKISGIEGAKSAFDIKFVFNKWTLGEDFCTDVLGAGRKAERFPAFDLLTCTSASRRPTSRPPTSMSAGR